MEYIPREKRIKIFSNLMNAPHFAQVVHSPYRSEFAEWLNENGYFDVPASIHHHGTQSGDLFRHSLKVAEILVDYTKKLC